MERQSVGLARSCRQIAGHVLQRATGVGQAYRALWGVTNDEEATFVRTGNADVRGIAGAGPE